MVFIKIPKIENLIQEASLFSSSLALSKSSYVFLLFFLSGYFLTVVKKYQK